MTKLPRCGPYENAHSLAFKYRSPVQLHFPFLLLSSPLPLNGFPAMMSTFPATFPSDSFFGNPPTPLFETGFPPWEYHEPSFLFEPLSPQQQEPVFFSPQTSPEPIGPNSGSGTSTLVNDSGSIKPNRIKSKNITKSKNSSSGSDDSTPSGLGSITDERKRKRMISNRESARRSRMRKMKHLENLRNQANRLKVGNEELMNRLRLMVQQSQLVRAENESLSSEAVILRRRLCDIRQYLLLRQLQQHMKPSAWPCINNLTSINQGQLQLQYSLTN